MKQNATYYIAYQNPKVGERVMLKCAYHDRADLRNQLVTTSRIVRVDGDTIETLNTVYKRTM